MSPRKSPRMSPRPSGPISALRRGRSGLFAALAAAIALVVIVACAPATPAAQSAPAAIAAEAGATVKAAPAEGFSSILVDDKGMTLYLYTKDEPNKSNCYDQCAANWPPLLLAGGQSAPTAGPGVNTQLLGVTTRNDGKKQVTYDGKPLYYWVKDQKPGDTTGQDVGKVWYVIEAK